MIKLSRIYFFYFGLEVCCVDIEACPRPDDSLLVSC